MIDSKSEQDLVTGGIQNEIINTNNGWFTRLRCYLKIHWIAFKWFFIELVTKHVELNKQSVGKRSGQVAVITGGGHGIGLHVVKKLLEADMHVIMGIRNKNIAFDSMAKLRTKVSTGSYEIIPLDLTSLTSVRAFAKSVLEKANSIQLLINNAGILMTQYKLTQDGLESTFQVNYVGHFLLTILLLPKMIATGKPEAHSRVINVSSVENYGGNLNFDDLQMKNFYSSAKAYMDSKLAQVISSNYLDRLVRSVIVDPSSRRRPLNINFYSVHPGVIYTQLFQHTTCIRCEMWLMKHLMKSPEQGSDGIVWAALSQDAEDLSGSFIANCKVYPPNNLATKVEIQEKLWEVSAKLVNLPSSSDFRVNLEQSIVNGYF